MDKKVSISWAITVCNEFEEIKRLLEQINLIKRSDDEIIILFDDKGSDEIWKFLLEQETNINLLHRLKFKHNFADWKNKLKSLCSNTTSHIIFLDADELLTDSLASCIYDLLELNPSYDCFALPRINTVKDIETRPDLIQNWKWDISKLDSYIDETILDLNKYENFITYNFLKENNLLIEENKIS